MKLTFAVIFILLFASFGWTQNAPQVEKVEPPNWWTNHSLNPLRMSIRGANLQNAAVKSPDKSLAISNIRINSRGDYLFFDLAIASSAKIGKYNFELQTPRGKTAIPFEILAPLDAKTNFQGVTNDDVVYLIMPDRFADGDESNNVGIDRANPRMWHGGDLRGVKNNLAYLKELGVTAIWLTPWYENTDEISNCDKPWCPATSYHGYGATDYYAVENHFGTMADLQELVREAHKQGLKVVQDQVANHVGIKHPWATKPPLENWFHKLELNTFNNSVLLSPNASPRERENLLNGWFVDSLPDINHEEPEAAKYQIQNALWWIGITGIDGIRQDTIQYMPRPFIRDWSTAINKQYPRFWMVGEIFEEDSAQTAFFQGGKTGWDNQDTKLPSVFDFKLWRTSNEVFTGKKPARALRDVLKYDGLYSDINNVTTLSSNHDTMRFMSLDGATIEGAKLHLAFQLTTRGIPQIYYGEELAWRGGHEPASRQDFPGGWKSDARSAFAKNGRTAEEQAMFDWTAKFMQLRRENQALKKGTLTDLFYDENAYVFQRYWNSRSLIVSEQQMIVAFNIGDSPKLVQIKEIQNNSTGKRFAQNVFNANEKIDIDAAGNFSITIPAKSVSVFEVKK